MRTKCFPILILLALMLVVTTASAQTYVKKDLSKIAYGMTTDEVRNIFGRPDHINTSAGPRGELQQWVYREGRYKQLYLYFNDGRFTSYDRVGER